MGAPKIDTRTYQDLVAQAEALVALLTSWRPPAEPLDAGGALIRIFSRYLELLIDRLNQVPERNYLAFLNLIGAEQKPPQPARVPLTFTLAANSPVEALVPQGTQAAAPPVDGAEAEVVFETDQDLVTSRTRLLAVFSDDPLADRYMDASGLATGAAGEPVEAFIARTLDTDEPARLGKPPLRWANHEHSLYLAHEALFASPGSNKRITLTVEMDDPERLERLPLRWSYWDRDAWRELKPSKQVATRAGLVVSFDPLPALARAAVHEQEAAWLQARLDRPLPFTERGELPQIRNVWARGTMIQSDLAPESAFAGEARIDLSKDFYPFGERPGFNDTFSLASQAAFSSPGGTVTLHVTVTPAPPVTPAATHNLKLAWEAWNGRAWQPLTVTGDNAVTSLLQNGAITLTLPERSGPGEFNGLRSYWLRARITAGAYLSAAFDREAVDANGEKILDAAKKPVILTVPPAPAPPLLQSLSLDTRVDLPDSPVDLFTLNGFAWEDHRADTAEGTAEEKPKPFRPFQPPEEDLPALYLGFDAPFANRPASIYVQPAPPRPGEISPEKLQNQAGEPSPRVEWEYSIQERGWASLGARDETLGLTRRGLVEFIGPADFAQRQLFGQERYWLRARWRSGRYPAAPRLQRLLLNTTWASQAVAIRDEILGSSNGNPGQTFFLSHIPVLPGAVLQVRESELPNAAERARLRAEEGPDAISLVRGESGRGEEIWVRWHRVPDFHRSGRGDRHYTLDTLSGAVRFGDGRYGLIPPAGQNSLRAALYRSGGGAQGNVPVGRVVELKSSLPYIERVMNLEEACGGAASQSLEEVQRYGPRQLRHRGRAVTAEDLEDLAFAASPEVARAKAIPPAQDLFNLWVDPRGETPDLSRHAKVGTGISGLVLVPRSESPRPVPSLGLLEAVRAAVLACCPAAAGLWVAGPEWMRVTVQAEIVPVSLAAAQDLQARVSAALQRYLHPLSGGGEGKGWPFGRLPYPSELYQLIGSIAGVDHVRHLALDTDLLIESVAGVDHVRSLTLDHGGMGAQVGKQSLIYSGPHTIHLHFG